MARILLAHSDPDVIDRLTKVVGQLSYPPSVDFAQDVASLRRLVLSNFYDVLVVEAEISPQSGGGTYSGAAAVLELNRHVRAVLLVVAGALSPVFGRLYDQIAAKKNLLFLGDPEHDSFAEAKDCLERLLPGEAAEPTAEIRIELGVANLAYSMTLLQDGRPIQRQEQTVLPIRRPATWRRRLEALAEFSPLSKTERGDLRLVRNWRKTFGAYGADLYNDLQTAGLEEPYVSARHFCGTIDRLHLHFNLTDDCHAVGVEALVAEEMPEPNFLMLLSPMTRALYAGQEGGQRKRRPTGPLNILCVLSDVLDNTVVDRSGAFPDVEFKEIFPAMPGLKAECAYFQALAKSELAHKGIIRILPDPSKDEMEMPLKALLEKELTEGEQRYDVVHFAGHCHAVSGNRFDPDLAFLILARPGQHYADPLPISRFADWLRQKNDPHLVFLSACRSLSKATAHAGVLAGIPNVIGYRWELPDDKAHRLVSYFYDRLLQRSTTAIADALRQAKKEMYTDFYNDPIWAAPMLFTHVNNMGERPS